MRGKLPGSHAPDVRGQTRCSAPNCKGAGDWHSFVCARCIGKGEIICPRCLCSKKLPATDIRAGSVRFTQVTLTVGTTRDPQQRESHP